MENAKAPESDNLPTSWNYGSFHQNSRLYTSFLQKEGDTSACLPPRYKPLSTTAFSNHEFRRSSKDAAGKENLQMENIQPRKVATPSMKWQRGSKSLECPK